MTEIMLSVLSLVVSAGALAVSCWVAIRASKTITHERRLSLISFRANALLDAHEQVESLERSIRIAREVLNVVPDDDIKAAIQAQISEKRRLVEQLEEISRRLEAIQLAPGPVSNEVEERTADVAGHMKVVIAKCRCLEENASRILQHAQREFGAKGVC